MRRSQGAAPLQEILALAPKLQDFAGSRQNFESLAGGLIGGTAETPWGKKVLLRGVLEGPET